MASFIDHCIVLKKIKLPQRKYIFLVFSKKNGCVSLFSLSSKKQNAVLLSQIGPLSCLRLASLLPLKKGGFRLDDFDVFFSPFAEIEKKRLPLLFLIAEIVYSTIKVGYKNPLLYSFLQKSILFLTKDPFSSNFLLVFLFSFAKRLGFACKPNQVLEEKGYFFSIENAQFVSAPTPFFFSKKQVALFVLLLGTTFDTLSFVLINKNDRHFFLDVLLDYYSFHLEDFRRPKSIAVLKELYGV